MQCMAIIELMKAHEAQLELRAEEAWSLVAQYSLLPILKIDSDDENAFVQIPFRKNGSDSSIISISNYQQAQWMDVPIRSSSDVLSLWKDFNFSDILFLYPDIRILSAITTEEYYVGYFEICY